MPTSRFQTWLAQPTTVSGLAAGAATLTGLAAHLITHDTTVTASVAGATLALVKIALPDNTGAQSSVEKLVSDAISAAVAHRLEGSFPELLSDGLDVAATLRQGPPGPAGPAGTTAQPIIVPIPVSVAGTPPAVTPQEPTQ